MDDLRQKVAHLNDRVEQLDSKLNNLDAKLNHRVDQLNNRVDQLDAKMEKMSDKLDIKMEKMSDKLDKILAVVDKMLANQRGRPLEIVQQGTLEHDQGGIEMNLNEAEHPYDSHRFSLESQGSLQDTWMLGECIGVGSFASVFKGRHRKSGVSCAIKMLNDPANNINLEKFEQEIDILSKIKHTNIVRYYGRGKIKDKHCIVLEYVSPGPIRKYLQNGAVTELIVRSFTRQILTGLEFLHANNIMHRDVKGDNVLVDETGTVKLADFGLAKRVTGLKNSDQGTPHYRAPETIKGGDYGKPVDIWSLGCTVIEIFTGKAPWDGLEFQTVFFNLMRKQHPEIPEEISAVGKDFLKQCFKAEPEERATATSLLHHPFVRDLQ